MSGSVLLLTTARAKRNALARRVVSDIKTLLVELKDLEMDIRQLWVEFENLPQGEKILGCSTKKQFCKKHLGKTPRAVRYMLDGGNHKRGETVSPMKDDPETTFADETTEFFLNFRSTVNETRGAHKAISTANAMPPGRTALERLVDQYSQDSRWLVTNAVTDAKQLLQAY